MVEQLALGLCECGCGEATALAAHTRSEAGWVKGQPKRFIHGHNPRGRKQSAEHRAKLRAAHSKPRPQMRGEGNPAWRGDEAGYDAKHLWINKTHPKTGVCEHCGGKSRDYANVSKEYKRERADWVELCTRCHKRFDRLTKAHGYVFGSRGWKPKGKAT